MILERFSPEYTCYHRKRQPRQWIVRKVANHKWFKAAELPCDPHACVEQTYRPTQPFPVRRICVRLRYGQVRADEPRPNQSRHRANIFLKAGEMSSQTLQGIQYLLATSAHGRTLTSSTCCARRRSTLVIAAPQRVADANFCVHISVSKFVRNEAYVKTVAEPSIRN